MKLRLFLILVGLIALASTVLATCPPPPPPPTAGLSVVGNLLKDANNNTVVLHGVNLVGSESACEAFGVFDTSINSMNDDIEITSMNAWTGLNTVTLPMHEQCWLGINGAPPAYSGANYINAIKHIVQTIEANGKYPVIALFVEGPGTALATSQQSMPDNEHAPAFWQSVANTFKGDNKVIFRLIEEPRPRGNATDTAAWQCWRNGDVQYNSAGVQSGTVVNCAETSVGANTIAFPAVGMQGLVNLIRATGATNIIALSGVGYSSIMNHFLDAGIKVIDTLNPPQLMASVDIYPESSGCPDTTCWNSVMVPIINTMPVWVGETSENAGGFVANTNAVDAMMTYWDGKGVGYSAWLWRPDYGQILIGSFGTGTAATPWGTDFKAHLATLH
jgi:hypothetical protein